MLYKKGSSDDPEQWLAYQLSGGLIGYPPPGDWSPQSIQLEENENWLYEARKHLRAVQERKYMEGLKELLRRRKK